MDVIAHDIFSKKIFSAGVNKNNAKMVAAETTHWASILCQLVSFHLVLTEGETNSQVK